MTVFILVTHYTYAAWTRMVFETYSDFKNNNKMMIKFSYKFLEY